MTNEKVFIYREKIKMDWQAGYRQIRLSMKDAEELLDAYAERDRLLKACEAVLIFHSGGEWDQCKQNDWIRCTGKVDATTRILCDTVRAALGAKP